MPAVKSKAVTIEVRGGESGNGCAGKAARDRIRRRADQERDAGPRDDRAKRASGCREKERIGDLRTHEVDFVQRRAPGARTVRRAGSPLVP